MRTNNVNRFETYPKSKNKLIIFETYLKRNIIQLSKEWKKEDNEKTKTKANLAVKRFCSYLLQGKITEKLKIRKKKCNYKNIQTL